MEEFKLTKKEHKKTQLIFFAEKTQRNSRTETKNYYLINKRHWLKVDSLIDLQL